MGVEQLQDKKEARPSAVAPGRTAETVPEDKAKPIPSTNYNSKLPRGQVGMISNLLNSGQSNAIPLNHLITMTGWPPRKIRRQIEAERRLGIPILADCIGGYFLPADEAELERCVKSMRGRAHEILKTATAIEKAAKEIVDGGVDLSRLG